MAILQYDISVVGLKSIDAAFAHVERRARQSNRLMMRGVEAARARGGSAGGFSSPSVMASRSARASRAAALTEEQVKAQVAAKGAALRERYAARTAARIATIEKAAAAKSEAEKLAMQRRADLMRLRSAERMARIEAASKSRIEARSTREASRASLRETVRAQRLQEAAARETLAKTRRSNTLREVGRQRTSAAIGSAALGSVTSIGRSAIGAASLGGAALVGSALFSQTQESVRASQLANQAGTPERKGEILKGAQGAQGFTGMEALNALGSWTDLTGDLASGEKILGELAATALATGTELDELAAAAGNAFIPLNDTIPDADARMKALQQTIRAMAGMGAVGAVEIKDLASEMAGLAAQATKFEGGTEQVMQTAVAMAQAARQRGGAASAAEAVTSVERFGSDALNKQGKLRQMGVEVFTDKSHTQMRAQDQIIGDVLDKTGGDLGKLSSIFGERSVRAIQGFSPLYTAAEKQKKGSGRAAVMAEFERLRGATLSDESVKERVASRMQDPDIQFKETMKDLNAALGAEFMPIMTDLVKKLKDATPQIAAMGKAAASVAGWAIENPYEGIGALIAAKVTADIAKAAIGDSVSKAIGGALGGSGGLQLGAVTIGAAIAYLTVKTLADAEDAAVGNVVAAGVESQNVVTRAHQELRTNKALSPETAAALTADLAKKQEQRKRGGNVRAHEQAKAAAAANPMNAAMAGPYGASAGADAGGAAIMEGIGSAFGSLTDWAGITTGASAETKATERRTLETAASGGMDKDIERIAAVLEKAAIAQTKAATELQAAAKSQSGLNRGNTPSAIK